MNAIVEAKFAGTQAFVGTACETEVMRTGFVTPAVETTSSCSPARVGWSAEQARASRPAITSRPGLGPELTIVDVLKARAVSQSDRDAYVFLSYRADETDEVRLTYATRYTRAKATAAALQAVAKQGERVLIVCPRGLDYIVSFFGCLLAGMVAVPAYPPRNAKHMPRLQAILADAGAAAVLAPHDLYPRLARWAVGDGKLPPFVSSDRILPETPAAFHETVVAPGDLAFLQYTSGTTGAPKGVMVTHGQAMENVRQIIAFASLDQGDFGVLWLPPYHDMGLVGGLLVPPVAAFPVVLMSPASFVQRPARWLEALSHYHATITAGPNFGYQLCVDEVDVADMAHFDLSSLRLALSGSEPVRLSTLRAFARRFASCGFSAGSLVPVYGMAETVLMSSGWRDGAGPCLLGLEAKALADGRLQIMGRDKGVAATGAETGEAAQRFVVSCGPVIAGHDVRIVDPETRTECAGDRVGEIWLSGPSVASGYWDRPDLTADTFRARLAAAPSGPGYLRTGDLGAVVGGEIYVLGRSKEMIIIRGRNHYAQDLEATATTSDPALGSDRTIAFGIEVDGEESIVLVHELTRRAYRSIDTAAVMAAMRRAVVEAHEIDVAAIVLVKPASLPRTTSGKLQRSRARALFIAGELDTTAQWRAATDAARRKDQEPLRKVKDAAPAAVISVDTANRPEAAPQPRSEEGSADAFAHATSEAHEDDVCVAAASAPTARSENPLDATASRRQADRLIDWLRAYSAKRLNSRLMDERRSIAPHVVLDFGNAGILGMSIPTRFGGLGLRDADTLRVIEQLGAIDLNLAAFVGVHLALGATPLIEAADHELKARLLPMIAGGRMLAAFALTEPGAGANPRALQARARRDGEHFVLDGDKSWIGTASWAGVINVFAREVDEEGRPQGITAFAVSTENDGLKFGPEALTMGMRGMVQTSVHLRGARVDASCRLGAPGEGFEVAMEAIQVGRLGIAAMCVGALQRCAQLLIGYARQRPVATGRLLDHGVTLERLDWMVHASRSLRALVQQLAELRDSSRPVHPDAYAAAKVAGSEWAWQGADWLMQGLGGRGYVEPNGASQLLRDARLLRIFEGPSEALLTHLGSRVLREPLSLAAWMRGVLGAPRAAARLSELSTRLGGAVPRNGDTIQSDLIAHRCGIMAQLLIIAAALEVAEQRHGTAEVVRTRSWLEAQLQQAEARLFTLDIIRVPGADEVVAAVSGFVDAIGDIEQTLPGEDAARDALIAGGERSLVGPTVEPVTPPAPTLPQRRETDQVVTTPVPSQPSGADQDMIRAAIRERILDAIAEERGIARANVDPNRPLAEMGVDSLSAARIAMTLERWLGVDVPPDLLWQEPTVEALAEQVAGLVATDCVAMLKCVSTMAASIPTAASTPQAAPPAENAAHFAAASESRLEAGSQAQIETHSAFRRVSPGVPCSTDDDRPRAQAGGREKSLSLFFFGSAAVIGAGGEPYKFILDCARFADQQGFEAIWTPERHFHDFGGLFPNPSVLSAALAAVTSRLHLRAGSVVLPLHHPARVVEEWSVVDHLSAGRAGVAVTPGWNPNDFVLNRSGFAQRFAEMPGQIDVLRKLWRGESVEMVNGLDASATVKISPPPRRKDLPLWLTCNRRPEGFAQAGQLGANVLTALLSQSPDELVANIAIYRKALEDNGFAPDSRRVTLMLHTYVGEDDAEVKEKARGPLTEYLRNSVDLWRQGAQGAAELAKLDAARKEQLLGYAFERYYAKSAMIGSRQSCQKIAKRWFAQGVDEIACLLDFGFSQSEVSDGLMRLGQLREELTAKSEVVGAPEFATVKPLEIGSARATVPLRRERTSSSLRLVCLPYAGGDAGVFAHWAKRFPSSIDVRPINVPEPLTSWSELLAALTRECPDDGTPYAIYGHSMGALIGFEWARHLRRLNGSEPVHLFVAAQHAPQLASPYPSAHSTRDPAARELLRALWGSPRLASADDRLLDRIFTRIEPSLRLQVEGYRFEQEAPLSCPVTALYGAADPVLRPWHLAAWQAHTKGPFELVNVDGGHLFVRDHADVVAALLAERLAVRNAA
jgi:natural product biosynthesis luciferase-like monooxygenase protein